MARQTKKIYQRLLKKFNCRTFHNWKDKESLSIRNLLDIHEVYTISGEIDKYKELKDKVMEAGKDKKEIVIKFVLFNGSKYINEIEVK